MLQQYYEIFIYNNELAIVEKIDNETYKNLEKHFEYVYHTKNDDTYQLDKNFDAGIDLLIVDDNHLDELLNDLIEQGFCDTIEFNFIDDYFNGNYNQYGQAF